MAASLSDWLAVYQDLRSVTAACEATGYVLNEAYPPAGFYVYALIDPGDDTVFYIGKGIGGRVLKHEERTRRGVIQNAAKVKRIQEIYSRGQTVVRRILFVADAEEVALAVESDVIHKLADAGLTNIIGGNMTQHAAVKAFSKTFRKQVDEFRTAFLKG